MKSPIYIEVVVVWILGIVLAKGFWSTLAAVLFPEWGMCLIVWRILVAEGWVT